MIVTPWCNKKSKKVRYTYVDARSHEIHRFSLGRYMDNNIGWEHFCTTSLYEEENKPSLQCQCETSVKGRYLYEQVGSNFKLQPSHTEKPTNYFVTDPLVPFVLKVSLTLRDP